MSKYSKQSKKRKQELKKQNIEARNERLILKALPKVLRKLEKGLGYYVEFMEVYDGYLGDFTGQIIPVEPVGNPFVVIHEMKLDFPHPNSLKCEQKKMFVRKIEEAFNRMGFILHAKTVTEDDVFELSDAGISQLYELLLFYIMVANEDYFDNFSSVNYEGLSLIIERFNCNYVYQFL
ncbi:MAG: hypothetical protein PF517_10520 [Salinivirgaceae bacterium]|jgi:hypothetical protein|nr:hypothetical protein [Salinivirgaceae bacterium]